MLGRALLAIAVLAAAWTVSVQWSGGFALSIAGIRVSSFDAVRPAVVTVAATALYLAVSGRAAAQRQALALLRRCTPASFTAVLSAIVLLVGLTHNAWTAGGPDSYAYVSQADLLLHGRLQVPVPLAAAAPWPDALETFVPLGYRAVRGQPAIAPATGPGLPLLMAGFKGIAGHAAAFLVVPLSGALLLWTTFLIGRRMELAFVGAGGAWLIATSPAFLMMFKSQMSDVPAAAAWGLAIYWTLAGTLSGAAAAGAATTMAILIRPNLVPIAAVLFVWMLLPHPAPPGREAGASALRIRGALTFALASLPGCLVIAAINWRLYGSPLSSGYGDVGDLFSIAFVPVSLARYARWLLETQTPLAAAGMLMLAIAPARVWPTAWARSAARLLACVTAVVWALYSVYQPFDAWWFLRFLLPSWPPILIGTAALLTALFDRRTVRGQAAAVATIAALGIYGLVVTDQRSVFPDDEGERRYATIAKLVEQHTDPDAMILASIHAGPVRYYAGRASMRFDRLDEGWLDRATAWLRQQGRHPYVLVEDWEMPLFTRRFAAANALGGLTISPVVAYRAYRTSGTVYLFDLLRPDGPTLAPVPIRNPRPLCVLPGPAPRL